MKAEQSSQKLESLQEELGGKVAWMTHIIQTKLPFNDTGESQGTRLESHCTSQEPKREKTMKESLSFLFQ